MDPLSRKLTANYPLVTIKSEVEDHSSNHLLFIDDLKLFAAEDATLKTMTEETVRFFHTIGLELNREKSATNSPSCQDEAVAVDISGGYKYLGIIEDFRSRPMDRNWELIGDAILQRVEKLCKSRLNGRNLFKAINEFALSKLNYYIGVLKFEPPQFQSLDHNIRQILIKHGIHLQPACKERLYLPRDSLGRGLSNLEFKSENMLLQLYTTLELSSTSTRRMAILKVEKDNASHLALIPQYLKCKYKLEEEVTLKTLKDAQQKFLYSEIKEKFYHSKLFRALDNPHVDVKDSSIWLRKGNNRARDEGILCFLQDRNIYCGVNVVCPHCKESPRTVDHLATRCDRMLSFDYTARHNLVLRSLHLALCVQHGFTTNKKLRSHSVQSVISHNNVEIRVDTRVKTDVKIQYNVPDIVVIDKNRHLITIVEVGVTNLDSLQHVESEKYRKYDLLAKEMGLMYKCSTKIIPYVLTWDGLVTKMHSSHVKELKLQRNIEAYIQSMVLKRTLEAISFDYRRGFTEDRSYAEDMLQEAMNRLSTAAEVGNAG